MFSPSRYFRYALRFLALYAAMVVVASANWFHRWFGSVDIDQILFHLQLPPDELVSGDRWLVHNACVNCLVAPVAYALVAGVALALLGRWLGPDRLAGRMVQRFFSVHGQMAVFALVGGYALARDARWPEPGVEARDWIREEYRAPAGVVAPAVRRNLVLIYAESLEFAWESGPFAADHLVDELSRLSSVRFPTYTQQADTGWTIAGIVSTQCGVPLKPVGLFRENRLGQNLRRFMPHARCLGDVLKTQGYRNVFLGGAVAGFSGKAAFLGGHGYDEVWGADEWHRLDPRLPMNGWGLNDDDLFDQARQRFTALTRERKPFNLTLLTVGMHPPSGVLAPSCPVRFHDYRDSVRCTSLLVSSFVDWVRTQDTAHLTDIVVVGDHLGMKSEVSSRLAQVPHRYVFNAFITGRPLAPNRERANHFDMYPTLLQALGFQVEGDRAGLGCGGFGPVSCRTLAGDPDIDAKLRMHSKFYESLWLGPD